MGFNALILGSWGFSEYWDEGSEPYYQYSYDAASSIEGSMLIFQDRLRTKEGKIVVLTQLIWRLSLMAVPGVRFGVAPQYSAPESEPHRPPGCK